MQEYRNKTIEWFRRRKEIIMQIERVVQGERAKVNLINQDQDLRLVIPFLEEHTEITAIACHTDYYARQILSAAKLAGISSIPVVCGFGNITSEFPDTIPIPTVEQHPEQQGRFAVERLFLRMKHPELVPEKFRFPPELLEKSTVLRGMKQRIILK